MQSTESGFIDVDPKKEIEELKAKLSASQGKVRLLLEEHVGFEAQVTTLEAVIDKLIEKLGDL